MPPLNKFNVQFAVLAFCFGKTPDYVDKSAHTSYKVHMSVVCVKIKKILLERGKAIAHK